MQANALHSDPLSTGLDRGANCAGGIELSRRSEWRKERNARAAAVTSELVDDDVVSIGQQTGTPTAVVLPEYAGAAPALASGPLVAENVGTQTERSVILLDFKRAQRQDEGQVLLSPGARAR